jgi:hypothetical protein
MVCAHGTAPNLSGGLGLPKGGHGYCRPWMRSVAPSQVMLIAIFGGIEVLRA